MANIKTSGKADWSGRKSVRDRFVRLVMACSFMTTLGSCRGFEASHCSAPEVVETVKSLSGGADNPLAGVLLNMANTTFALDAIRTVSSSSNETVCQARLTISYDMTIPTHLPQEGPVPPGTPTEQKMHVDRPQEVTYKLEKTDDGRIYVTIIPSEADILDQQNAQQQEQARQYEQEQRRQRQFQQDDQRYEQYQRDLQERLR